MDEYGFAVDVAQCLEGAQRGATGQRQSTRLLPAQTLRLRGHRVDGHGHLLRERAGAEDVFAGVGDDLVADLEFRGVRAEADDDSGHVPAWGDGELDGHDRIEVTAHKLPVDRVHSGGTDLDEHRCRRDLRIVDLANGDVTEVVGVLVIDCCTHNGGLPVVISG